MTTTTFTSTISFADYATYLREIGIALTWEQRFQAYLDLCKQSDFRYSSGATALAGFFQLHYGQSRFRCAINLSRSKGTVKAFIARRSRESEVDFAAMDALFAQWLAQGPNEYFFAQQPVEQEEYVPEPEYPVELEAYLDAEIREDAPPAYETVDEVIASLFPGDREEEQPKTKRGRKTRKARKEQSFTEVLV